MSKKIRTSDFIRKAKVTHGDKYDYSLVDYKNTITKIKIICKKHGVFEQAARSHISGSGCPKCFGSSKLTHEQFIEKVEKIHNDFYSYPEKYINNKQKIKIICPLHGEFKQTPSKHYKHGCPKCGFEKISKKKKLNTKTIIEKAEKIHDSKYDYSLVDYKNSITKIKIICKKHGVFEQIPKMHIYRKQGCPKCNNSHGEQTIETYLIKNNIEFIFQKTFENCKNIYKLPFDFFIEKYNLCIEFDGEQHFKPITYFGGEKKFKIQQKRDSIKNIYCIDNNINLLRIRFDENIEEKIINYFSTNR